MGPISSKVKQSRPDKSKLGDIDKKSNGTIRKVDEEVQENRGRYLSMALEEKRNLYKTKTYVVLNDIKTWQQQAQAVMGKFAHENVKPEHKVDERLNNKISLWQGDITTVEIDAIVNAANNSLMGGGGVDGAIHAAAGSKLRKECATISPCETGDAKITAGYKLPARYIIHTVGPIGENPGKLSSCYNKSMEIMKHEKLRTVAFSCISTGVYGYDIEKATPVVMKTVRRWLTDNHENIERILFCVYRPKDLEVYERNLLMYFPVDSDGNRLGSTNNQKETTESKADKVEKVKSETERVIISKNGVSDKKTKEDGLGPDNTLVVWKEIKLGRLGEKEQRDAINEIDILSLLNHANIITYYNHFLDGDTLLIELEYANGGNLSQKIDNQKELFDENVVKWYLYQLASALDHCHHHGIIHRDVKSLNIFLTKTDLVKLGDFGISKILESQSQLAETVAGTPLYMSPELMKGDKYNHKTDIWALGCVLFELLTLTRTFQGTNHLKLAYEIVCGEHGDISSKYSTEMRDLVNSMLLKDPKKRPSAEDILQSPVLSDRKVFERRVFELNTAARKIRLQSAVSVVEQTVVPVVKSKVTEVYQWGGGKMAPQKQDIFVKGRSAAQVSAGHGHFAVVTMEKELYTWANVQGGQRIVGQLGHGDTAAYRVPKKVETFEGIGVIQADCGEDFTVCVTDDGNVYSFGSDYYGCLGCDNEEGDEVTSPLLLNFFSNRPVQEVSCGDNHVVALTQDREVYTWGCGEFGRLGLGSEDDISSPQKAETARKHTIHHVYAGTDGTFLLTATGRVLACGSNEHNKLGFNSEASGLKKRKPKVYDIPCKYTFTLVRPLVRLHVVTIATGHTHSAVIDVCSHLHTFGCNKYGQLGLGDFKVHGTICRVQGVLTNHRVEKVTCGDGFTVVSTSDNHVYAFGNGDNGRLGGITADQMDFGKGPNGKSVSIPRPIFGALHIVPHLSARHWHCILIAEKVLNQKTLKTRCSLPKTKKVVSRDQPVKVNLSSVQEQLSKAGAEDSAFSMIESGHATSSDNQSDLLTGDSGIPVSPGDSVPFPVSPEAVPVFVLNETSEENAPLPPWLEAELEDEVIPIPADFVIHSPEPCAQGFQWQPPPEDDLQLNLPADQMASGGSAPFTPKEDNDSLIKTLQARIQELEEENKLLKETVESQRQKMKEREHCQETSIRHEKKI